MGKLDDEQPLQAILRRADDRLAELCGDLCSHVAQELRSATETLLRKVDGHLADRTPSKFQDSSPRHSSLQAPGGRLAPSPSPRMARTAWADDASVEPKRKPARSLTRALTGALCTTSRALHELELEGEEMPRRLEGRGLVPPGASNRVVPVSREPVGQAESDQGERSGGLHPSLSTKDFKGATERIFGLMPQNSADFSVVGMSPLQLRVRVWLQSSWFQCLVMSMVMLHSLLTGYVINTMSTTGQMQPGPVVDALNIFFCIFFALEVAARLYVYRVRFFTTYGCAWNIMDFVVTLFHIFEEIANIIAWATASNELEIASGSVVRTIRVLRGIKVLRLIRFVRYAEDLQLIVSCLILSFRTFLWSIGLLVMTFYVMAIYVTQTAYMHRREFPQSSANDGLEKWWGSIFVSMLSVLQALSGGVDWNDLVQPLLAISPGFALVFVLYIGFCFFALLNVIAGTYVEKVSRQAADLKARTQILKARRVFQAIDQDHSGYISLEEIQNQTATSVVLDFFESVDVDASEAQYLLEVLDMDGSGTIHFEEFLQGTIRLNSAARAADLLLVAREMKRFFHQSNLELQLIKKQLGM